MIGGLGYRSVHNDSGAAFCINHAVVLNGAVAVREAYAVSIFYGNGSIVDKRIPPILRDSFACLHAIAAAVSNNDRFRVGRCLAVVCCHTLSRSSSGHHTQKS